MNALTLALAAGSLVAAAAYREPLLLLPAAGAGLTQLVARAEARAARRRALAFEAYVAAVEQAAAARQPTAPGPPPPRRGPSRPRRHPDRRHDG
ncbi:MAG: hypothetical protein C0501_26395 [Isosphaera sp.]|nr:hypothetical protein [Isosphaera sp.]